VTPNRDNNLGVGLRLHPPESIEQAATWLVAGGDTGITLAGPGAPLVAEFCIAEFALAIGRSTDSGRALIAHAVETRHRLPQTWTRVVGGDLPVWRARRIAELTLQLSPEAAGFVDAQVALYVHVSETAVSGQNGLQLARVENTRSFVTAEQVKTWCATPGTEVVVKPVIDLAEHLHVEAYQAPKRLDEQTTLINHACVFPWCTRPARWTDSEHPVPYSQGGTTSSDNQAPVCRRHHS
jgi:hypothetical protein